MEQNCVFIAHLKIVSACSPVSTGLFSVPWEAPPSLPANNHVKPQLEFPSFSFAGLAALPFPLTTSLASSDRLHVVAFVLAGAAQDFSGQAASSYCEAQHDCGDSPLPVQQLRHGGQAALLPWRGSLWAWHEVHRYVAQGWNTVLSLFSSSFRSIFVLVVQDQPQAGLRLPAFIWVLGLLKCSIFMSSYTVSISDIETTSALDVTKI